MLSIDDSKFTRKEIMSYFQVFDEKNSLLKTITNLFFLLME